MGKPNPVSPTKPEAAHGSLSFFQPKPGGPISPHAGPVFSPHGPHHSPASPCAQRQSRFGPRDAQPASARPRLTPLTSWPHWLEPSPSSAQDPRRDAASLFRAEAPLPAALWSRSAPRAPEVHWPALRAPVSSRSFPHSSRIESEPGTRNQLPRSVFPAQSSAEITGARLRRGSRSSPLIGP